MTALVQKPAASPLSPGVSVCIPTHNRKELLKKAVASALSQSGVDLEIVISDNGSTDGTPEVAEALLKNPRVRYHRNHENLGAARNWELLVQQYASRRFATFLPDDDRYACNDALARLLRPLLEDPAVAFCSASVRAIDTTTGSARNIIRAPCQLSSNDFVPGYILNQYECGRIVPVIFPSATLFRTEDARSVGACTTIGVPYSLDVEMFVSLGMVRPRVAFLSDIVAETSWREDSESYSYGGSSLDDILEDRLGAYSAIMTRLRRIRRDGQGGLALGESDIARLERLAIDRAYNLQLRSLPMRREAGNCSRADLLSHLAKIARHRPAALDLKGLTAALFAMLATPRLLRTLRTYRARRAGNYWAEAGTL